MRQDDKELTAPDWDGERYIPGMHPQIELEHRHRYFLAARFVTGKRVLDVASGEGYGSAILAREATQVTGLDIDNTAVMAAQSRYSGVKNVTYFCGSAAAIPFPDASFDVVTSFETIEHHDQHEAMISEIRRVLVPDGLLIISSPNKLEYSDIPAYSNPHHVKELYLDEFRSLLKSKFANLAIYGQRVATGSIVMPVDDVHARGQSEHLVEADEELRRAQEFLHPLYFIALASSSTLPDLGSSYYENDFAVARFGLSRTLVETKAYARYGAEPYGENITSVQYSPLQTQHRELVFPFGSRSDKSLSGIRLDFSDSPALLSIDSISLSVAGSNVWSTTFGAASFSESFALLSTPDNFGSFNALVTDPEGWAELAVPGAVLDAIEGAFEVRVRLSICALVEGARLTDAFTRRLFDQMLLAGLLEEQLRAANTHARLLEARIQELSVGLRSAHDHVALIHRSLSWKLTRPMRVLKRLLRPDSMSRGEQLAMLGGALARRLGMTAKDAPGAAVAQQQPVAAVDSASRPNAGPAIPVAAPPIDVLEAEPSDGLVTADWVAEDYVAEVPTAPDQLSARLLAFYLPQFHPIPENDAWWGRGFTEWSNVTRARPQFVGHYQPHLPGELGFYDLRVADVLARQVELAQSAGIYGFCFYFYWFGGKRLLELPLLQYLRRSDLSMPFCLCWANENWTRKWDGQNHHILIEQQHSEADDIRFISYLSQYLRDPRYIRVAGKPLVVVYRPSLLPDPLATSERWRKWARDNGIGELHLAYTQSFEKADPGLYGFDAAIEFPPNNTQVPDYPHQVRRTNQNFSGVLRDWRQLVARSRNYQAPEYRLYRGVTPSWDNEARRPGRGTVLVGSSPAVFSEWVEDVVANTIQTTDDVSDRLVFVNAWNEWAEGAHLEPDRRYGYAWLHATRQGLLNGTDGSSTKLVMVVHDAHPHGAQYLALHLLSTLTQVFHFSVAVILLGAGVLKEKFEELAVVHDFSHADLQSKGARERVASRLFADGYRRAVFNTVVSAAELPIFKQRGFRSVVLIHEMEGIIRQHKLTTHVELASLHADVLVFPAEIVKQSFSSFGNVVAEDKVVIRPQGLYKPNSLGSNRESARRTIRERHAVPADSAIVLGAGFADRRKGIDLFIEIGRQVVTTRGQGVVFIWIGHWPVAVEAEMKASIAAAGLTSSFIFPGRVEDTELYFAASDVFALTSREDPFPSVALEAMDIGVPVIAFSQATGLEDIIGRSGGRLALQYSVAEFAGHIGELLDQPEVTAALADTAHQLIRREFSFRHYVFDLLDLLHAPQRRVSVVIPNYNYARYIEQRIATVASQTYPIFEIVVLDDCSTDDSTDVMRPVLAELEIDYLLVENEKNSGSVFAQWVKGAKLARGEYVWIAEADDLSLDGFLAEVMRPFSDHEVVLSYCESQQIEEAGNVLSPNYHEYVADISRTKWSENYVEDGAVEVREALAIKNTIPNVSAVVFQKRALLDSLEANQSEIATLKVAGDWLVYLGALSAGKIAFSKQALNLHRRHQSSVTLASFDVRQLREIRFLQSLAAQRWHVGSDVENTAHQYLVRLCHQFGVSEAEVTSHAV